MRAAEFPDFTEPRLPSSSASRCSRQRSVEQWLRWGARRLAGARLHYGHGTDHPSDEAFVLARAAFRLPHRPSPARMRRAASAKSAARFEALVRERIASGRPAAYLVGECWYAGLRFKVDERVLVPRSPIAELIVERFRPWITRHPARILDLCAGSGCLAIACARAFPRARVDAAELDQGALQVLRQNIALHRVGRRVRAVRTDLFGGLRGRRYDLIVTNPPYVPTARWKALPREYTHEPRLALEAGRDGMDLVARILREAPRHLADGGTLVCEVGGSVPEFNRRFAGLPVYWPEFEHGGDGVFIIHRNDLLDGNAKNVR